MEARALNVECGVVVLLNQETHVFLGAGSTVLIELYDVLTPFCHCRAGSCQPM